MARHSDCRHVCDDKEHHHENLYESDHVHEDHDDHCSAWGNEEACLVIIFPFYLVVFKVLVSMVSLPAP